MGINKRDEKSYREEKTAELQQRSHVIQDRIDAMYIDKLDGKITQEMFERKSDA